MLELLGAMGIIILQRIPLINRLECVRNAGTVAGALTVINKALAKLDKVEAQQAKAAERTAAGIAAMENRRETQLEEAATAAKVKKNLSALTE